MKIKHKRGDDWLTLHSVEDRNDKGVTIGPVDITGWGIKCQVKRGDTLVDTFDMTITDALAGKYQLACPSSRTSAWPVAILDCDIQYTVDGKIGSTDTFQINCLKDVTQ